MVDVKIRDEKFNNALYRSIQNIEEFRENGLFIINTFALNLRGLRKNNLKEKKIFERFLKNLLDAKQEYNDNIKNYNLLKELEKILEEMTKNLAKDNGQIQKNLVVFNYAACKYLRKSRNYVNKMFEDCCDFQSFKDNYPELFVKVIEIINSEIENEERIRLIFMRNCIRSLYISKISKLSFPKIIIEIMNEISFSIRNSIFNQFFKVIAKKYGQEYATNALKISEISENHEIILDFSLNKIYENLLALAFILSSYGLALLLIPNDLGLWKERSCTPDIMKAICKMVKELKKNLIACQMMLENDMIELMKRKCEDHEAKNLIKNIEVSTEIQEKIVKNKEDKKNTVFWEKILKEDIQS